GKESQVANRKFSRQGAPCDVGVGEIVADGANRGEQSSPAGAPQRQPSIGRVKIGRQTDVSIDQKSVEAEDFHFLGGFNTGGGLPDIVEFAPLRGADEIKRIALGVEMRLADKRRNEGQK